MKERNGFVSNSSSTSFMIENKTKERLHLRDFVKENPQLIDQYIKYYWHPSDKDGKEISTVDLIKLMCKEADAKEKATGMNWSEKKTKALAPGINIISFGDKEMTHLGEIYDYALRDGGESKRFRWYFHHYER
jgi:hypothetical protein